MIQKKGQHLKYWQSKSNDYLENSSTIWNYPAAQVYLQALPLKLKKVKNL